MTQTSLDIGTINLKPATIDLFGHMKTAQCSVNITLT